jgi:hypothetical protein
MNLKKLFKIRNLGKSRRNGQKGQALAIVLCLLLVVSLVVASALTFVGTSLKTNISYSNSTKQLYSAESGIQDAVWQMLNDTPGELGTLLQTVSPNTDPYNIFNYYCSNPNNNKVWTYQLSDSTTTPATTIFNGYNVNIKLKNTWVPLVDYNNPSPSYVPANGIFTPPSWDIGIPNQVNSIFSNNILQTSYGSNASLVISGSVTTIPVYNTKITYTGTNTSSSSLPILSIGCWLPLGFTYNNSSSNLYVAGHQGDPAYALFSSETTKSCAGNIAVVWTFPTTPTPTTLYSLEHQMGQTIGSTLALNFTYSTGLTRLPECLPWVVWGTSAGQFTWDADITVSDMVSYAGSAADGYTTVEAYVPKSATAVLGNALDGDYVATGGANRTCTDNSNGQEWRNYLIGSSSSTVNVIPPTASVEAAYLYWGGWVRGDADPTLNSNVTNTGNYFYDGSVTLASSSGSQNVNIDTSNPDDVYWSDKVKSTRGGTITVTPGSKNVTGNGTDFSSTALYSGVPDGGLTRDQIGVQNTDGTYSWFIVQTVTDNTHLTLKSVAPSLPLGSNWTNQPYVVFDGYYYGCKVDVTDFVRDHSTVVPPATLGNGNSTYTVSNLYSDQYCVQDQDHSGGATETCSSAWGGWSLVIIYTDASVLGHQLYLFDNFNSIANDGKDRPFQMSGFIVPTQVTGDTGGDAIKLTAFVGEGDKHNTGDFFAIRVQNNILNDNYLWDGVTDDPAEQASGPWVTSLANADDAFNSESINSASTGGGYLNASGVDIDTFHVPWSANLVQTNDTIATAVINPAGDGIVSLYLIASFRSSVASGGSVSYLIKKSKTPP